MVNYPQEIFMEYRGHAEDKLLLCREVVVSITQSAKECCKRFEMQKAPDFITNITPKRLIDVDLMLQLDEVARRQCYGRPGMTEKGSTGLAQLKRSDELGDLC